MYTKTYTNMDLDWDGDRIKTETSPEGITSNCFYPHASMKMTKDKKIYSNFMGKQILDATHIMMIVDG